MRRQPTVESSDSGSKDKDHIGYLKTLRRTVSAMASLSRKQRVCKTTFEAVRMVLETLDSLLESSEGVRVLFRKGKEFTNRELSDEEENRMKMILEIEANLPKLNTICASLIYSADQDVEDKKRLARKFVGLYDAANLYPELLGVYQRISGAMHNLAADEELQGEEDEYFLAFQDFDDVNLEGRDAGKVREKLETHLSTMANARFFTNDCNRGKKQFESSDIDTSSMEGIVEFLTSSPVLKELRKNLLIETFKFGAKTKVQIIENSVDSFKEKYIGYHQLNLEKQYLIEKYADYSRRFTSSYIGGCFGVYQDAENRGFQLCFRQPEMTLRDYIAEADDFSAEIIIRFTLQVTEAVKFSHESLEPLGDIRPDNMYVKVGKKPQIVMLSVLKDLKVKDLTSEEELLEMARYMAPELLVGHDNHGFERRTKAGDVYAIGMLLWEMMQKKKPFSDVEDLEKMIQLKGKGTHPSKILEEDDDLIAQLEYHKLLDEVFAQTWKPNPLRRPPPKKLVKKKSALKKILKIVS